jgi:hypothetical protein
MTYTISINSNVLKSLIAQGVFDVDQFLFEAVTKSDHDLCQYLLEHGADVNRTYHNKSTYYIFSNRTITLLHLAVRQSDAKLVTLLLNHGADINAYSSECKTPLHYANNLNIVKLLVEAGADYTLKDGDNRTPKEDRIDFISRYKAYNNSELQTIADYLQSCDDTPSTKEPDCDDTPTTKESDCCL